MQKLDANTEKIFLTLCLLVLSCWTIQLTAQNSTNQFTKESSFAVLELIIYYDTNALRFFGNSSDTLTNYWKSLVWELHLKFQSVPNINISFRLNSILDIGPEGQRKLIDPARLPDGSLSIDLLKKNWAALLHNNTVGKQLLRYDVPVLLVGEMLDGDATLADGKQGGACLSYDDEELDTNTNLAFITMHGEYFGNRFTPLMAYLLNAPDETKRDYEKYDCDQFGAFQHPSIMTYTEENVPKHFFSKCAENVLKQFLESDLSTCLKEVNTSNKVVLDTSNKCSLVENLKPLTLREQCQTIVKSKFHHNFTVTLQEENECKNVECHVNSNSRTIQPMAGSECFNGNNKGICYVGQCITPGGYMLNMGSSLCLENVNAFSWTNKTSLYNCLDGRSSTPLDYVKTDTVSSSGIHIKFLALNENRTLEEKCLSLGMQSNEPHFEACQLKMANQVWKQVYLNDNFLLKHVETGKCLVVESATGVAQLTSNSICLTVDNKHLWKYVEEEEILVLLGCKKQNNSHLTKAVGSSGCKKNKIPYVIVVFLSQIWIISFS